MNRSDRRVFQAQEFASLAGVTVRTLHHYDRLGLLKPNGYSQAGYRLYGERDIVRLQQIVTLKFIGFPLKEIKYILDRNNLDLAATLRLQREILAEKRRHLDTAIAAIEQAEGVVENGELDWEVFRRIIEVMKMEKDTEWMKKYYTEEQLAELSKRWSPELQERVSRDWATLIKDVEAALSAGADPASAEARALAKRWTALVEEFTGGDPALAESLKNLYTDEANWSPSFKKSFSTEVEAFVYQANASHKQE